MPYSPRDTIVVERRAHVRHEVPIDGLNFTPDERSDGRGGKSRARDQISSVGRGKVNEGPGPGAEAGCRPPWSTNSSAPTGPPVDGEGSSSSTENAKPLY